jgi:glycine/D-amino acid oxidase-like deaminating enzyme
MTTPPATTIPTATGEAPAALSPGDELDVLVVGAGGAGLSAAVFAAIAGLRTAVIERTDQVGGTTAFTAGTTWVPGTHRAEEVGAEDTRSQARDFLDAAIGSHSPAGLRQRFLDLGPEAVTVMESGSHVTYRARAMHPDYLTELPGARLFGRALEPYPFDGTLLGPRLALVRDPLPEFTVFDGMSLERDDIGHLLGAHPHEESRAHLLALRRAFRDAVDEYGTDTRRTMGNALIAGLLHTLDEARVPVLTRSEVTSVTDEGDGAGHQILISEDGHEFAVRAHNLIFASGGFNRSPERRARLLPGHDLDWCPGAPGHTGQAHDLIDDLGGRYGTAGLAHTYYAPVSRRRRPDGSWAVFPHFVMDRAKPHMVVIDQNGHRYLNESTSYHLFGMRMVQHDHETPGGSVPSFLITDAEGMRRYGLGMVHPFQSERKLAAEVESGYLLRGDSIAELAEALGVPVAELSRTIERTNGPAGRGEDPDFHRGSNDYERFNGDAGSETGHPNVAPVEAAPFYAVRLFPGDIGAATGYVTNESAAVLDRSGQPMRGIYAVGNDMQSVMGGVYPAPGITIGPGLVFAYAAVRDILGRPLPGAEGTRTLTGWDE